MGITKRNQFQVTELEIMAHDHAYTNRMSALVQEKIVLHGINEAKQMLQDESDKMQKEFNIYTERTSTQFKKLMHSGREISREEMKQYKSDGDMAAILYRKMVICSNLRMNLIMQI